MLQRLRPRWHIAGTISFARVLGSPNGRASLIAYQRKKPERLYHRGGGWPPFGTLRESRGGVQTGYNGMIHARTLATMHRQRSPAEYS